MFADEAETIERVREIQAAVAELRGLEARRDVPTVVESPAIMRERMEREIDEQLDGATRHGIDVTWKLLGLVDDDFDVASAYAEVLEDAVGGYFDVEEGRLVLIRREVGGTNGMMARMMEDMVIAHELVHGLQDQHFDLWSLSRRELGNGDAATAVQCLVEGDASYAMLYRLPVSMDPDRLDMKQLAKVMASAGGPSATPSGTLGDAPRILREPLLFPYVQGMVFAQAVKKRQPGSWDALDAAYAQPPLSTEQILHPERYGPDGDWPVHLAADAEGWVRGQEELQQDTLGELGIAVMLRDRVPLIDADAVADGWDGDRLWTFEGPEGQASIVWRTTWDSEDDAVEFAAAAERYVKDLRPLDDWTPTRRGWSRGRSAERTLTGVRWSGKDVVVVLDVPRRGHRRTVRKALGVEGEEIRQLDQLAPPPPRPDASDADEPDED